MVSCCGKCAGLKASYPPRASPYSLDLAKCMECKCYFERKHWKARALGYKCPCCKGRLRLKTPFKGQKVQSRFEQKELESLA